MNNSSDINTTRRFNPATQLFTFYYTHIYLDFSYPAKPPRWWSPYPCMHSNGDVATLADSSDTHGACKNCDFSS